MKPLRRAVTLPVLALVIASLAATPAATQELEIATTVSMLEGPTVDAEGNVYFTDILMQRIMRFSKDGTFSVFRDKSNIANGLVFDPQGRLIAAEGAASPTAERSGMATGGMPRVTRTDLKTGRVEILADKYAGKPLSGPNDVTIDARAGCTSRILPAPPSIASTGRASWRESWRLQTSSGRTVSRSHPTIARSMSSKPTAPRAARA